MISENESANQRSESAAASPGHAGAKRTGPAHGQARSAITRRSGQANAPLSFAQQRLWFLDQLHPESPLYNFPVALRLAGVLNVAALERALGAIVARHEALRTRFVAVEGNPAQVISAAALVELPLTDLNALPKAEREAEGQRILAAEAKRPFNLAGDLMIRCLLLKLEAAEHIFMVTIHHIATDAWSVGIFFRELAAGYEAFCAGRELALPELAIQYADFAVWQQAGLRGEILEQQLAYWKRRLAGANESLALPLDRPRPATQTFVGATQYFKLPRSLMEGLKQLSQRERATLFMTLLAAFKTLLHRYSHQEDLLVGVPIAGRARVETEANIGFFVNTLVLRTDLSGNPTFRELLGRVRNVAFEAFEHQDLPFEKLVAELHPERNASQMPLIQVMFVQQKAPTEGMKLADLALTPVEVKREVAKFDLTFFVEERGQEFVSLVEYNVNLFDAATIERMAAHWEQLLAGIVANPAQRLSDLPWLTAAEKRQLLVEWNDTRTDYPRNQCAHELFDEQARTRPQAVAVTFGKQQLTYGELNARANQLAHYLKRTGVASGKIVGLCMERSLEMIVGLLAILKAGGAYASLDPASPKDRLARMLEDLQTPVVLTQRRWRELLSGSALTSNRRNPPALICLDTDGEVMARESTDALKCDVTAENLAYVSFTSGSTGRPKGVCVPHRGVVRLVRNTNYASFSADEVFLQMAPISFDASTLEIWGCLLNGGRLVVLPPQTPSLSELAEVIQKQGVTTAWFTSGLFNQLADEHPEALKPLRQILTGGDVLSPPHVKKTLSLPGARRLINGYGPTENTTFTACYTIPSDFNAERSVPIGRPIANTQCYILDEHLQPVPFGVPGELYTGGDGLASGYLNQPELTAEKFVPNPFQPGTRLYKTGDLVRHLPDGNIEFLGRMDHQVKIRGFRVEPGEIEVALGTHPQVQACIVAAQVDAVSGKRLVAYYVARQPSGITVSDFRDFLKSKLPEYMIPTAFVQLAQLPLTPNGKVDRRALPAPSEARPELDKKYAQPRDIVEMELTAIWESILGVKPIGTEDKFFDLGGHSLLAVRLLAQVEKKFAKKLPLAVVFQAPTIGQMANYLRVDHAAASGSSVIEIQAKGDQPPIFFVHGVGGGMFWGYTNLARSLGLDQPVYALKSRSMDGQEEFSRIEEMAAQYVADVRALQPKGPYHLGGYCFGGNVAYEMARQLVAAGEPVALLAVMNCAPPNSSYWAFRWTPARAAKFLRNLGHLALRCLQWGSQQRKEFLRWKAALARRKIIRLFRLPHQVAYPLDAEEIVDLSSFPADQRKLWEIHIRALIDYFPQPYAGKITLFRSRGHPLFCSYDRRCGWGDLAEEVEVHIVPGAHESILEEPHVRALAERLKECLTRAQRRQVIPARLSSSRVKTAISNSGVPAGWNETSADYPRELCVHQLFEEQVKRTPDAPAVIFGTEQLSYHELNRRANQLAGHLSSLGVGPDVPVGICLERSVELVVGLLGILKAGGAYVSLDPAYPRERLALMLENSQAPLLLTQQKFVANLPAEPARIIALDAPLPDGLSETNQSSRTTPENLAYVIYTSGSTGQPKGVAMEHRPLVNLIWWQLKHSRMGRGDRTLQFASPSFDVSFQEIFSTWCSGGALVLISEELRHDPRGLLRLLQEEAVNRLFLPFIALSQLTESAKDEEIKALHLREIITAGEQLRITGKMAAFFEKIPGCTLHNHYGPSESHVVTAFTLTGAPATWPALPPIGKPIANAQIHLLDEKLNPVPVGESGEVYLGGDCLARGYLHRPDLTAERFISYPHSPGSPARLYKTGDLARYLPDGNLEFQGRIDNQVKIRGYRIELGEIETVLGRHPLVRECVVTAREDVPGQKRLVGYVVGQPGQELTVGDLRRGLQDTLPDYMMPSAFVFLNALPLTPSGKVNRLALPAPDQNRPQLGGQFVSAANDTETRVAAIWSEVLNLKQVGMRDNFFDLGGNSVLIAQVISRLHEAFQVELSVSALFEAPTIAALAAGIATRRWAAGRFAVPPLKRVARNGNPPLSFTQGRLWFIDRLEPGSHAYNVPAALRLEGPLNANALQASLEKIVQRHEVLRTTIAFEEGNLAQVISSGQPCKLAIVDLTALPAVERGVQARQAVEEEARQPFDLARGPLLRCTLFRLSEREHILVVVMHHIISDGWSLGVFFRELDLLYHAHAAGRLVPILPSLPVQYADYVLWQQAWMQGPVLEEQVVYWKENLNGAPLAVELPLDHARENDSSERSTQQALLLPKPVLAAMQSLGRREGMTPFMIMMAGLALTLYHWTQQTDLVIGTVVAGRNRRELENLIGCFMNFVPLRTIVAEDETGRELLEQVKETMLEAHAHQDCPFEKMVEAINPERRLAQNPLYNVALLMQNFPSGLLNGKALKAEPLPVDLQASLLDLRFIAEESARGMSLTCEYKTDLFGAETIRHLLDSICALLADLAREPEKKISQYSLTQELTTQAKAAKERADRQTIAMAATFTAEPVAESLKYWMRELEIPARIEFAPYNQVFQQLLDPTGILALNQHGINVVCVRLEDWERFEGGAPETAAAGAERVERNVLEFMSALKVAVGRGSAPYLVCLCPEAKSVLEDAGRAELYRRMKQELAAGLSPMAGTYLVSDEEIAALYPVADYHDPRTEELGGIPYTPVFFAALGSVVARKFHALKRPAFKAIVLDCDETLWAGVCGEDGPRGIQLDPARQALQEFMRAQCDAGMLLCLCSKNNEEDVAQVFERRREMPLKREHFAAWRINWQPKSENLKSLAEELRIGLDSFIFVDDNPVECAEVEANCPEVLTLQLPESPELIPQFLKHCWVFDHLKLSAEDRQRNASYQQERQREQLRAQSPNLGDFLAGLDLKVDIAGLSEEQVTRVSQLTLRTNQFNFTTQRRTESDFQTILRGDHQQVLTVSVSDRFGAYGLVGVIIHEAKANAIEVDTFLLSCRVLGRGVECQMIARLGQMALARGLARVDLHYAPSQKNRPAFNFLEKVGARFRQGFNGGYLYRLPAEFAAGIAHNSNFLEPDRKSNAPAAVKLTATGTPVHRRRFSRYRWIALEANDAEQIYQAQDAKSRRRPREQRTYTAARTETEKLLCKIWEELLRVKQVGLHDNFFELGGHSLLAVRLFAEVEKLTGRKLPLVTVFQSPTIKQLAEVVSQKAAASRSSLVAIQAQGSRPPLFLIHGAGGDVLWGYANLAPYLGADQPVYGVKSRALNGVEEFPGIEEMAAHYIGQIQLLQPEGPYYLGGYCFGGNVAYEMARQLHAQGETVALVALLDSAPANAGYEQMRWWQPKFIVKFAVNFYYWLEDFSRWKPEERRNFISRKGRAWGRKIVRKIFRRHAGQSQVDLEEIIDLSKFPPHELRLWQIHLDILGRHVSRPYARRVALFRTKGQPLFCSQEDDFGWGKLTGEGVDVRMIPGSHESIFMEPNVRLLAAQLNKYLSEVVVPATSPGEPELKAI